ncbi:hypothetical protein PENNAL_c0039G02466 [Penicillium nalgiovense]|uniref:Uncharacterized protein n=1 Tax=Penicillium nalgiovense TaxID=60175 RepID=A0A1V6Y2T6_PENNA|nr:hypothetical protein PENNAL_c0039G02466 [Penicillium nalgiovense]
MFAPTARRAAAQASAYAPNILDGAIETYIALANANFLIDWMPVLPLAQWSLTGLQHLWGAGITRSWALAKELDIEEGRSIKQQEHQANVSPICRYYVPRTAAGMTLGTAVQLGSLAAGFGVAVGSGALFLFGEVPRVRNDILRKLPFLDTYYDRSIAPEDNPF